MNKAKILVVEDDKAVRNLITTTLETQNYQYHTAEKGSEALLEAVSFQPDVMLLDLGLPDMDGVDIIKKVRTWSNTPIIVISARSEDHDKVEALDAGADDYLTKPFSVEELLARLRAMTRQSVQLSSRLTFGSLCLDQTTFELSTPSGSFRLANKEYQMMELFLRNPRQIIPTERFLERIWGYDSEVEVSVVWVYISYLRKKLAALQADVEIRASRNLGYALEVRA